MKNNLITKNISVDTGTLLIIDPCNGEEILDSKEKWKKLQEQYISNRGLFPQSKRTSEILNQLRKGVSDAESQRLRLELGANSIFDGFGKDPSSEPTAILFETGWGDGEYTVTFEFDKKNSDKIKSMKITFID